MSGLPLSQITFGTMRLAKVGSAGEACELINHALAIGISSFHCSFEYDSFPLFVDAWRDSGGYRTNTTIVAKVAVPHYGEDRFSASAFRAKTENYLSVLGVDRIVVQWLLRFDLKQEEARLRILLQASEEVAQVVDAMKKEGKIAAFIGFPYTMPIADALVAATWCDGLALYVNALEPATDGAIELCARAGKPVVAIRPYAAGRVFTETPASADDALAYVFAHPPVASAVVSASSIAHLDALRSYAS